MRKISKHVLLVCGCVWLFTTGWSCKIPISTPLCTDDNDCPSDQECIDHQCVPKTEACIDNDQDGYGQYCEKGTDCDDNDDTVYPGATELCDTKDNNCDGIKDSGILCNSLCCPQAEICLLDECMVDLGTCEKDEDCQEDSYCHEGQCIPYGKGPRGDYNPECTRLSIAGLFQPALQCEWTAPAAGDYDGHIQVLGTPMVADFDFDQDPETIEPSIVFLTYDALDGESGCSTTLDGVMRIINGKDCTPQFTLGPYLNGSNPVAIGDLDLDGRPEIVAHRNTGSVIAYKYNPGLNKWEELWVGHRDGDVPVVFGEGSTGWGGPSLADLDNDGFPEVLSGGLVYDSMGLLLDEHLGLDTLFNIGFPVVADLDSDGKVELVGGDNIWTFEPATKTWEVKTICSGYSGFTAVADFGTFGEEPSLDDRSILDGIAEIAVVSYGEVRVDNILGRTVFGPISLPASTGGGPPTIGDFDGDGRAEVAVSGSDSMTIFDPDCDDTGSALICPTLRTDGILWTQPSQDHSSNITGSSLFDFEGDGVVEAIYADECFVRVYRGADGTVLYSQWRSSCTWIDNPIVADVDGDFSSELVVPSNQSCGNVVPQNMGGLPYDTSPNGNPMDPLFAGLPCEENADCVSDNCVENLCRCETDIQCGGGGFVCAPPPTGTPGSGNTCRAEWQGKINGIRVYRDSLDRWVGSRFIWNQHAYSITNVSEDGIIPKTSDAQQNWKVDGLNNFRQNIQGDLSPHHSPDMTAGQGDFNGTNCDENGTLTLQVRACNRGTNPIGSGISLGFYDGDPAVPENKVCGTTTTKALEPGECEIIECIWPDAPMDSPRDITVAIDDDKQRTECIESNNLAVIHDVTCIGLVD